MLIAVIVLVGAVVVLKALSLTGSAPLRDGTPTELPGCPDSPNCVCSQNSDEAHTVAPIQFTGEPEEAWANLKKVIERLGGRLVSDPAERYARFEFRSLIFRYVDDLEILLDEEKKRIEIRSASRSGHSDLGVNRRRVEDIREAYERS